MGPEATGSNPAPGTTTEQPFCERGVTFSALDFGCREKVIGTEDWIITSEIQVSWIAGRIVKLQASGIA